MILFVFFLSCSCGTLGELLADGQSCHIEPRLVFGYLNSLVFADEPVNGKIQTVRWEEFGSNLVTSIAQDYDDERIFWLSYSGRLPYSFGFVRVGQRRIKTVHQCESNFICCQIGKRNDCIEIYLILKCH